MKSHISLKHVLASVIKAIDMYSFLLKGHHRRTAIIAYQLGNHFGLEQEQLNDLVLAASLHDIGALYITERDQIIKIDVENPEPHEIRGANILAGFQPFDKIAKIIRYHHIRYEDVLTRKVSEDEVPLECYILHLADRIDVLLLKNEEGAAQRQKVTDGINERFGSIFAPILKQTFQSIAATDDFWKNIYETSFYDLLFMSLQNDNDESEKRYIESLALVLARIVDDKSPWTSKHSQTVSALAYQIGQLMELTPEECFELKIAGYLHDIGKVAIASELLDKPGKLSEDEFKEMKSHVAYSSLILSPISELSNIVRWAINHHEKRDGSGYPLHLRESAFDEKMDIVAYADIFSALAEDRPYRKGMNKDEILSILREMAPMQLSDSVFQVIHDHMDVLYELQKDLMVSRLKVAEAF